MEPRAVDNEEPSVIVESMKDHRTKGKSRWLLGIAAIPSRTSANDESLSSFAEALEAQAYFGRYPPKITRLLRFCQSEF